MKITKVTLIKLIKEQSKLIKESNFPTSGDYIEDYDLKEFQKIQKSQVPSKIQKALSDMLDLGVNLDSSKFDFYYNHFDVGENTEVWLAVDKKDKTSGVFASMESKEFDEDDYWKRRNDATGEYKAMKDGVKNDKYDPKMWKKVGYLSK